MKKAFIISAAVLLLSACSFSGEGSSAETSILWVKEQPEAKICTLTADTSIYFRGIDFDDPELCKKVTDYCNEIQEKYEPLSGKELDDWNSEEKPKGAYISARLDNGVFVNIDSGTTNNINICRTIYLTDDGETVQFYQYLEDYIVAHSDEAASQVE